jgi:hypothetical protein
VTIYYRTTDGRADIDLTTAQFNALPLNKQSVLRTYSVDPFPTLLATQYAFEGPVVVDATTARKTWTIANKTPEQLAAEALAAELAAEKLTNDQLIIDIKTQLDIDNATFNAMTDPQKFQVVRTDRRLLLRACRYLLRKGPF